MTWFAKMKRLSLFQEDAVGQIVDQRAQYQLLLFRAVVEASCSFLDSAPSVNLDLSYLFDGIARISHT